MGMNISNMNPPSYSSSESEGSDNEDSLKIHQAGNKKDTSLSVKEEAKKASSVAQDTLSSSLNVKRPLHQDDQDVEDAQIGGHIQNTVKKRLPSEGLNVKVLSSASSQRQTENTTPLKSFAPPINKRSGFSPPYKNPLTQTTTTTTTSSSYKKSATLTPQTLDSENNKHQAKRKEKFKPPYNTPLTQTTTTTSSSYKKTAALTPQTLDSEINKSQAKKKTKFKPPYNNPSTQTTTTTTTTSNTLNVKNLKSERDHAEDVSYQRGEEKEYEDPYHKASLQTTKMGEGISTQDPIFFSSRKNLTVVSEVKKSVPSKKLILEKSSKINPPQQSAIQKQTSISSFEKAMAYLEEILASSMTITNETVSQNTRVERVFQALQTHIENTILTEEFIEDVYTCLFESDLAPFSEEHLNTDMSFIRPHPVHVIHTLAECLRALPNNTGFLTIIKKAKSYLDNIENKTHRKGVGLFPVSKFLQKSTDATLIKLVNDCPLYTASDWIGSDNQNPVFILRTSDFNPKWVFKPMNINSTNAEEANELADIRDCEHFAFKMNFHEQFPIPAVFLIKFRGVAGTVQPFIPGTIRFNKIPDDKQNSILPSLQKLLIFDLLFLNHDRNGSNWLYRKEGDSYVCYGIDHEHSLKYQKGAFTMDQIGLINELSPNLKFSDFDNTAKNLFSEENCNKYLDIMQKCFNQDRKLDTSHKSDQDLEMENKMLNHIVNVGKILRESTGYFHSTIQNIKKNIKSDRTITKTAQSNTRDSFLPD